MAVEYSAVALGIAALMFYLLEFGSRINFQTSGRGWIDLNDLAKTVLIMCSLAVGIGLVLFMYGVVTTNTGVIESVLLVLLRFWITMVSVVLLFIGLYYFVLLPRIAEKQ